MAGQGITAYVTGFITSIVTVVIAVTLIPTLINAVGNVTGIALLDTALVGTIVGAGIVLFIVKTFL